MQLIAFTILFAGAVFLTAGDLFMKTWTGNGKSWFFAIGLILYLVADSALGISFKSKNIALASVIMITINVILLLAVSWFYYKEKIGLYGFIGIILGVLAVLFMELDGK